jgi:hypothetical protein
MESGGERTGAERMRTSGVEKTRRGVETMEVVDGGSIKGEGDGAGERARGAEEQHWERDQEIPPVLVVL